MLVEDLTEEEIKFLVMRRKRYDVLPHWMDWVRPAESYAIMRERIGLPMCRLARMIGVDGVDVYEMEMSRRCLRRLIVFWRC